MTSFLRCLCLLGISLCWAPHSGAVYAVSTNDHPLLAYSANYYRLDITFDPGNQYIDGTVDMHFYVNRETNSITLRLDSLLSISHIVLDNDVLPRQIIRSGRDVEIHFQQTLLQDRQYVLSTTYRGIPRTAPDPPWQGGMIWAQDVLGRPWAGVACQAEGASLWWPCNDHIAAKPDSVSMHFTVPDTLVAAANGRLKGIQPAHLGYHTYLWKVTYPISTYNVSINIGSYSLIQDSFQTPDKNSALSLQYYVLDYNRNKAEEHFAQVTDVLLCFGSMLDHYPFWNDGYKLIETPYLGMEHQSGIAYGNKFMDGYLGRGLPDGIVFDYIIIHETAHEWFGNSVSALDYPHLWIHESFGTYLETVYVECMYGKDAALRYINSQRMLILNGRPLSSPLYQSGDVLHNTDKYYKGAWMLHTVRNLLDDDDLWFAMLRELYRNFSHSRVTTDDITGFIASFTGLDLDAFFKQYIYQTALPLLQYTVEASGSDLLVTCRWQNTVPGFDMPVKAGKAGRFQSVFPVQDEWRTYVFEDMDPESFTFARHLFLINTRKMNP